MIKLYAAYTEGYNAVSEWHRGVGFCAGPRNPHAADSEEYDQWNDGAQQAHEDAEDMRWLPED